MKSYTFEQLDDAIKNNHSARKDFIKHLLTIASGMLAILASFHKTEIKTENVNELYLITLIFTIHRYSYWWHCIIFRYSYCKVHFYSTYRSDDRTT